MTDTVRTYAVNQTQLATNGARGITAQKIRDFLASVLGVSPITAINSASVTTYAPSESDEVIYVNTTTASVTINLAAAAGLRVGKVYTVVKTDASANTVTLDASTTEVFDGVDLTKVLAFQYSRISVVNTGVAAAEWITLSQYGINNGRLAVLDVTGNGAIAIPGYNLTHFITKGTAATLTIADPTATVHNGVALTFISTTAAAHTLSNAAGSGFFSSGGSTKDVATFSGAIGDGLTIIAYQGKWYIDSRGVTGITLG